MNNAHPLITLQHISVRRKGRMILDEINLTIRKGEHVAIIGPNGAGKSTLVHVISEEVHPLWTPQSKRILFGREMWPVLELRKRLGIVSQSLQYLCNTHYTVKHIVLSGFFSSIGLDFHHLVTAEMEKRASQLLQEQHIGHLEDAMMIQLSSGEARRALLARASVHDPEVMLLDEAVSNLDLPGKKLYRDSLTQCVQHNKTLVVVTHDISEIIPEIEHIIVMKRGKIHAQGKKREVLTEEILSSAYDCNVFISQREGRFTAWC